MKPVKFKGHNLILGKDQPQYRPLPACNECTPEGSMVYCWKLNLWQRVKLLFTGRLFVRQLTFGTPFQPILPMLNWDQPKCQNCGKPIGEHKHEKHYQCP